MGNIIGDRFDNFVISQIISRQQMQGAGYLSGTRNNNQLQLLTNKNAWLKCASSVFVDPQSIDEKAANLSGYSNIYLGNSDVGAAVGLNNFNPESIGEKRLKDIGLTPVENFTGTQLAEKAVLFNTLSELAGESYNQRSGVTNTSFSTKSNNLWNQSNSYGLGGSDFGLNPAPGLISFNVDSQNRGSIRKGTLVLKCYNAFQFQLLELLYLRIGYSMMVEWGWDKFSRDGGETIENTGNTIIEDKWFKSNTCFSQLDLIREIGKYQKIYDGNYDGFFGRVENFQWEFNPDGTYDIQIFLVTVGAVAESLSMSTKSPILTTKELNDLTKDLQTKEGEAIVDSNIVSTAGTTQISQDLFVDIAGSTLFDGNNSNYINVANTFGAREYSNEDDKNTQTISKYNYYLTLGELLDKIEKGCIPIVTTDCPQANDLMLQIDKNDDTNVCAAYPNQVAIDPKICIIKPLIEDPIGEGIQFKISEGWDKLKDFGVLETVTLGNGDTGTIMYGKLMNIYINYEFVSELLNKIDSDGEISLFKFLTGICDGINRSLGYVNNLEVSISDDKIIRIIDQNPIIGAENSTNRIFKNNKPIATPLFEIFGYNPVPFKNVSNPNQDARLDSPFSNFVTDFKFTTRISPGTATTVAVGATAAASTKNYDGTAFSKWNQGLIDRFALDVKDPKLTREVQREIEVNERFTELGLDSGGYNNISPDIAVALYNNYNDSKVDMSPLESIDSAWEGFKAWMTTPINQDLGEAASAAYNKTQAQNIQDKVTTTALNVSFKGPRFVKSINGYKDRSRANQSISWEDYVEEVDKEISIKNAEDSNLTYDDLLEKFENNWDFWIVASLGGTFQGTTIANGDAIQPNYWDYNDVNVRNGLGSFKAYINALHNFIFTKYGQGSNKIGFIPADLSATFEGLSGIKIYQALSIRQRVLPPQYPEALKFLISTVNHDISNNNWSTTVNTLSVPNISLTPSTFNLSELRDAVSDYREVVGAGIQEFTGATPNADLLRVYINQNSWLTEKQTGSDGLGGRTSSTLSGGELTSNGDITLTMAKQAILVFAALHRELPDLKFRITGGNDLFHANTPAAKNSRHKRGLAIDFVIDGSRTQTNLDRVKKVMGGFIANPNSKVWYLDEYGDATKHATGAHFHFSIDSKEPKGTPEKLLAEQQYAEFGDSYLQPKGEDNNILSGVRPSATPTDAELFTILNTTYENFQVGTRQGNRDNDFRPRPILEYRATVLVRITSTGAEFKVSSFGGNTHEGKSGYYSGFSLAKKSAEASAEKQVKVKLGI